MELATGPLPSRATTATPTEHRADPWSDFLRRVLVPVGRTGDAQGKAKPPESTVLPPAALSGCHNEGLPVE